MKADLLSGERKTSEKKGDMEWDSGAKERIRT